MPVRRIRKSLTREEQKALDRSAEAEFRVPQILLMEHAGLAVADTCDLMAGARTTPVHIFTGKGNNAGDAYVCARLLYGRGYRVTVWDCFPGFEHTGLAAVMRASVEALGICIRPAEEFDPGKLFSGVSRIIDDNVSGMPCVIIDGILGTGFSMARPLPPPLRKITVKIEEGHIRGARVIAIDIPTVSMPTREMPIRRPCRPTVRLRLFCRRRACLRDAARNSPDSSGSSRWDFPLILPTGRFIRNTPLSEAYRLKDS
jgi:NAD(P)H-hydrate repair Nnr-like enzyme with NAD(P)H-hydrate epimerase domain